MARRRLLILKVDPKGRIQVPKKILDELGIGREVRAMIEDRVVKIEPVVRIRERLAKTVKFHYTSVERSLPKLRKAAERQLLKEISQSL